MIFDGVPTEIVGVMPASFPFPIRALKCGCRPSRHERTRRSCSNRGVARLRDGARRERAHRAHRLIADLPRVIPNQRGLSRPPSRCRNAGRPVARALWILLASVGLVLLVACANVANLFLVRSEARQREVAVRRALGAGRVGIARYFLAESVLLSLAGGALGLVLAWARRATARRVRPRHPAATPRNPAGRRPVAFTFGAELRRARCSARSRCCARAGRASLHENGRGNTASRGRHRARQLLMGAQVALALVLLVSSGLMVRSFQKLRALDPGFDPASALTFSIGCRTRNTRRGTRPSPAHDAFSIACRRCRA